MSPTSPNDAIDAVPIGRDRPIGPIDRRPLPICRNPPPGWERP
jgi:hypothetical protein